MGRASSRIATAIRAAGVGLWCGLAAWPAMALDATRWEAMQSTAQQAAQECLHLMHHDTDEFSACVDARLANGAKAPEVRMGNAYLGLVGCLSAARIATLHADVCARAYLVQVDSLRRQLRLDDAALCPIVRGDCRSRTAQIAAMRREVRATSGQSPR